MNTLTSILDISSDPIAFESKHQQDFERLQLVSEFAENYQEQDRITFEDGKYDGELDIEPQAYQWFDSLYRKGYTS